MEVEEISFVASRRLRRTLTWRTSGQSSPHPWSTCQGNHQQCHYHVCPQGNHHHHHHHHHRQHHHRHYCKYTDYQKPRQLVPSHGRDKPLKRDTARKQRSRRRKVVLIMMMVAMTIKIILMMTMIAQVQQGGSASDTAGLVDSSDQYGHS